MAETIEHAIAAPPIFQAVLTPYRSMGRRGMFVVFGLMAAGSLLVTSLMYVLGAFPVIGFNGADLILAITLYAMNMRAARASEVILLTNDGLTITRTTPRGRRSVVTMAPAWLRVQIEENAGSNPIVTIVNRDARHIVGADLGEAERRDLAEALRGAFARLHSPRFDNVQTRE
ncbi:DUF2244 domain-containing protein [Acidiphilium sp. AL]|uniref:DUF2244 domain-containing protein n=1 Tax=Acidiphilium iwatense TaxID=768198 RepID=A0ABS9DWW0_9PROT|nr:MULTISPECIES: DUF2244 domain-containing protein [Acidiphilium]MCF3947173.1 DUF2244 domain-containing protein [Acidiphilium iwatense]MCU4160656.1 DUF2244 domain-containing protein [Acidiphilium sp. AL]